MISVKSLVYVVQLYNLINLCKLNGHIVPNQSRRPINSGKINDPTKYIVKRYTIDKK